MRGIKFSAAFLLTGILSVPAAWADAIGEIRMARGEATVLRGGQALPAQRGMAVQRADRLRTGADGRIAVTFDDQSRFSVGPGSEMSLDRYEYDSRTKQGALEVGMDAGSLAISTGEISKHTPDAIKVRTPTTILGARGTEFIVEVTP